MAPLALAATLAILGCALALPSAVPHLHTKRATKEKAVFAHVMFGEVPNYKVEDHAADMRLAAEIGLDAFAINTGHDPYDQEKVANFFQALEQTGFKAFFSFDLLHYNVKNSSEWIKWDYMDTWGRHENYYQIDGKPVVSTFGGNQDGQYINGESSFEAANAVWNLLIDDMKNMTNPLDVYFAPFWLKPLWKTDVGDLKLNAVGNWFGNGEIGGAGDVTADADTQWKEAANNRSIDYWAPISAHFSVHQVADRNYVYKGGDFLLPKHYEDLINLGDMAPDYIEFITWSDWGESTYMGPLHDRATPPKETVDTAVYVDGHDHTAYALLSAYYNYWYKKGSPPTIKSEALFFWHRGHPLSAKPKDDPLPQPGGASVLTDTIYTVVLVPPGSKATTVVITTGGKAGDGQALKEGVNQVMVDFVVGDVHVSVQDDSGKELIGSAGQTVIDDPQYYDYNYYAFVAPANLSVADYIDTDFSTSGSPSSTNSSSSSTGKASASNGKATGTTSTSGSPTATSDGSSSSDWAWWVLPFALVGLGGIGYYWWRNRSLTSDSDSEGSQSDSSRSSSSSPSSSSSDGGDSSTSDDSSSDSSSGRSRSRMRSLPRPPRPPDRYHSDDEKSSYL